MFSLCLALLAAACSKPAAEHRYTLQGQVLAIAPTRQEATIKHEAVRGFMDAMTMPFKVRDSRQLDGVAPGDLITATLVIVNDDAYLTEVKKTGSAPMEQPAGGTPSASSGFDLLKPGEQVPGTPFVDQDGRKRDFTSFKGSTVVLTFIYTRCPLPNFCPLMDEHFATIQKKLAADPVLKGRVHLVTVSFDPATDTPPVLQRHAKTLDADLTTWTFLTGDGDAIDRFAARFGVWVTRAADDPGNITHNLRTAIIDSDGRLVKLYTGNDWLPDQVMADLKPLVSST